LLVDAENSSLCLDVFSKFLVESGIQNGDPSDPRVANDNQLQIMNGEVEKVINREKEQMLQETDLIELFDSGDASGKRGNRRLVSIQWFGPWRPAAHTCAGKKKASPMAGFAWSSAPLTLLK